MKREFHAIVALLLLGTSGAMAACPPETGGTAAEEIRANQARIVCLQTELAAETRLQKLGFDIKESKRRIQDIQLRQRIDALPTYVPPPIYVPRVFQPTL